MKKSYKYIIGIVLVLVFALLALYNNGSIGVSESKIESDARMSQRLDAHWQISKSISYPMAALLFYDTESHNLTYSIYLNRKGFSFGYFFRSGGSRSEIKEGVCEFHYDGYGKVLLSMNKAKIERIEIDNGQEIKTLSIDSEKPFSLVLPQNYSILTLYDIHNNTIPITSISING